MAHETGTNAGTGGMSAQDTLALPDSGDVIGYVQPFIGRAAKRDVVGYFGFPIVTAGQIVTPHMAERAQNMGRLFELIAATEE